MQIFSRMIILFSFTLLLNILVPSDTYAGCSFYSKVKNKVAPYIAPIVVPLAVIPIIAIKENKKIITATKRTGAEIIQRQ